MPCCVFIFFTILLVVYSRLFFFFFNLTVYWQAGHKSISVSKSSKSHFRMIIIMGFFSCLCGTDNGV